VERLEILNGAFAPGACVAEVARRRDVSRALLCTWRHKLRDARAEREPVDLAAPAFAEAVIVQNGEAGHPVLQPAIIIGLAQGKPISIFASASPALVTAALKALR
jgi:transposase